MDRSVAARILGVQVNATQDEIHTAYRRLARELHPDSGRGDERAMADLNAAYSVLREGPNWEFANVVPESDLEEFDLAEDEVGDDRRLLRMFVIAFALIATVAMFAVFITAVGYDWSLAP